MDAMPLSLPTPQSRHPGDDPAHAQPRFRMAPPGRRPRVLLAWEHGRNFGRLSRLLAVARLVEEQGGEPVWVVPKSQLASPLLGGLSHRRFAAPAMEQETFAPDFRADSFADVLLAVGFDDAGALLAAVHAWAELISAVQPASVVLDYAPVAQLAVDLLGQRAFQLTNGFDAPPPDCPMFANVRADSELGQRNAHRVEQLSATITQVGREYMGREDCSLASILQHPVKVFECIAETDPYGPRPGGLCIGPLGAHTDVVDVPWPESRLQHRRVFAHLRNLPGATDLLDELRLTDAVTLCVWRDAPPDVMQRYRNTNVRIVRQPVALDRVLPEADAVLNYGSTALVSRSLLAGKPQLMLPTDFEKFKVAQRVAQQGAGVIWHQGNGSAREAIGHLLHAPGKAQAARAIAAQYPPVWLRANRNRLARDLIGYVELEQSLGYA